MKAALLRFLSRMRDAQQEVIISKVPKGLKCLHGRKYGFHIRNYCSGLSKYSPCGSLGAFRIWWLKAFSGFGEAIWESSGNHPASFM